MQLLEDLAPGSAARTDGAPHLRAPGGTQALNLQFVLASLPCAALGIGSLGGQFNLALPLLALLTVTFWECLFAGLRRRPVDEGILLTAWLFVLLVPVDVALAPALISLSFAVVFGKAVFGGSGRYLVSPPLLGLVFLTIAYPDAGNGPAASAPGPGFEVAGAVACLIGAAWLIGTRSASWRVIAGVIAGAVASVLLATTGSALGDPAAPGTAWLWVERLTMGGFAFGAVFVATDPAASAMTNPGRWLYGMLAGLLAPFAGVMYAILLASLVAPLFDAAAVALHVRRRSAAARLP